MTDTWIRIALATAGMITTRAGAAMHILPGPGFPILAVDLTLLTTGVITLGIDYPRR
ncbi:hypothetical protein ACGFSI_40650 [Streptomyces virginiae]|uniref:hypothetical protein n=1 Tax=Streptomyces virginiae TaxID=1961 RepID=UPI00370FB452